MGKDCADGSHNGVVGNLVGGIEVGVNDHHAAGPQTGLHFPEKLDREQVIRRTISLEQVGDHQVIGVPVTAETAPHYFTLTDEALRGYDTLYKVNPPLRSKKDLEAVKEGLRDGTIDVIATAHAPHALEEKSVEFVTTGSQIYHKS